jgi:hypothetical protein
VSGMVVKNMSDKLLEPTINVTTGDIYKMWQQTHGQGNS